ncbi:MAG: hypothetical protein QXU54_01235 [Candidatus Micrarchaeia archaeon]
MLKQNVHRGQGSVEYLFILGVLFVVGLVVLGLLTGLGASSEEVSPEQSAEYWRTAEIGIVSHSANSSVMLLTLHNSQPFKITIDEVSLIGKKGRVAAVSPALEMVTGQESPVLIEGIPCEPGSAYRYTVQVVYSEPTSGRMFVFVGKAPVMGTCGE